MNLNNINLDILKVYYSNVYKWYDMKSRKSRYFILIGCMLLGLQFVTGTSSVTMFIGWLYFIIWAITRYLYISEKYND